MGWTLVASGGAQGNGANSVVTGSIDCTGANLLIIWLAADYRVASRSVADSLGNVYLPGGNVSSGLGGRGDMFYCYQPTHVGSMTFSGTTVPGTVGGAPSLAVFAFSGADGGLDQVATGFGYGETGGVSARITPSQSNELWVSFVCGAAGGPSPFYDAPTCTLGTTVYSEAMKVSPAAYAVGSAWGDQTAISSLQPYWNTAASGPDYGNTVVLVASFFGTGSPPPPPGSGLNAWLVIEEPFTAAPTAVSGVADGTYYGVALNGAGGTGATATVVVAGGIIVNVDPSSGRVPVTALGNGYQPVTPFSVTAAVDGGTVTFACNSGGLVDQSLRLYSGQGQQHSVNQVMFQRGSADIPLIVGRYYPDSYFPTVGSRAYLYDQTSRGPITVFAGTISRVEQTWFGNTGARIYHLSCVTLESIYDTIRIPPFFAQYAQWAGAIVSALLALPDLASTPVTPGNIQNGAFVPNYAPGDYPAVSEAFQKMAELSQYLWQVVASAPGAGQLAPQSIVLNFAPLSEVPAPFSVNVSQINWDSMKFEQNRQDYRNRQILGIQQSAFAQSSEAFAFGGSLPAYFTLMRPPDQITFAWITSGIESSALGTFTGQPSPGDTITISYPTSGSVYNFQNNYPYADGQIIIDSNGNIQVVTAGGISQPSGTPTWSSSIGGITSSGSVAFTCEGPPIDQTYVFVTAISLDNTQWGQVVIQPTLAGTVQALCDAINCKQQPAAGTQGTSFSWPTWENGLVNAYTSASTPSNTPAYIPLPSSSSEILVCNKPVGGPVGGGQPYTAALSKSCANFSWSAAETSGGVASGTAELNVAVNGTSSTANIYYTPGQTTVALASVPNNSSGGTIQIQYTRLGGGVIVCENTQEVYARAALEHSTGHYEQYSNDDNQTNAAAGLLECQQALAAFDTIPTQFTFDSYVGGLLTGQALTLAITGGPPNLAALVNSTTWFVQEIKAQLISPGPRIPGNLTGVWLEQVGGPVGSGHYIYTITVIDAQQVATWLRFWQDLIGGGGAGQSVSGGGGGSAAAPGQRWVAVLDLGDTTVRNNIAFVQNVRATAVATRMTGRLRLAITADLEVRFNVAGTAIGTLTIPSATAVGTLVISTTFIGSTPIQLIQDQELTFDVLSSDGSQSSDGVATFTLEYQ